MICLGFIRSRGRLLNVLIISNEWGKGYRFKDIDKEE